ncbi:sensor histidine kinase [Pollutibacter soli]|uniref:sensor histidine kinase n=1 Tax=Pollutibacter soli TaxID=3034157 RepID=UPI0030139908
MKYCITYVALIVLTVSNIRSFPQEGRRVFLNKYTHTQGLSNDNITHILQDKHGFLWIGTQEGLNIFDGNQFQNFSKYSTGSRRLGGHLVEDLVEDKKNGWIWVLTSQGDICAFDPATRGIKYRIEKDQHGNPLSARWFRSFAFLGDTILIGGSKALFGINLLSGKCINLEPILNSHLGSKEFNIAKIVVDKQRGIWLLNEGFGVIQLDSSLCVQKSFSSELANKIPQVRKLRFWNWAIQADTLYTATSWGLRRFNIAKSASGYIPNSNTELIDSAEIRSICFPTRDTFLFSTTDGFYIQEQHSRKTQKILDQSEDNEWLSSVFSSYYDKKYARVWVGTLSGLAGFSFNKIPFASFSKTNSTGETTKHLFALLPLSDKKILCGDESGIYMVSSDLIAVKKISNTASNYLLFRDANGNIFTSNKSGLFIIKHLKLIPAQSRYPELHPLNEHILSCAIQFNDSIIIFASAIQKGITLWNKKAKTIRNYFKDSINNVPDDLSFVNGLYKTEQDELLIVTNTAIIIFNPVNGSHKTTRVYNAQRNEYYSNLMDICKSDNGYCIATYGSGLIFVNNKFDVVKNLTSADGLSNNCVYRVFEVSGSILATTNIGLSVVTKKTYFTNAYYMEDGLHSDVFEQMCGYKESKIIYAGGSGGFTRIETHLLDSKTIPPKLYVTGYELKRKKNSNDSNNIFLKNITIESDVLQTTIRMTGIDYLSPGRISYSYKLNTAGNEWISVGRDTHVNLIGLTPGEHRLMIRATNESGILSEETPEIILTVLPKWYQTFLFKFGIASLVIGLIYAAFRYRLNQVRRQHEIRQEISRDLHDDIGSTLNSIKIFTHLARNTNESEFYFSQIEESVNRASYGLRDMIWVLEDEQDSIYDLMERIKKFALPVCHAKNIEFLGEIDSDKTQSRISKSVKKNLLLIAKEAINNAVKYAECTRIEVRFQRQSKKFICTIIDNGKGFPKDVPRGNGLNNMKYRARQINFNLEIFSRSAEGTQLIISKYF